MGFGDLKTEAGVKALNEFLADKSYIEGYTPSQGDAVIFAALGKAPSSSLAHALRWYNHIKSYGSETSSFPGEKKAASEYGSAAAGGASAAAAADDDDDDDDIDLFGSDSEDDEELEKIKQKRLEDYHAKKSKTAEAEKVAKINEEEEDDDFDLFGSDDEEEAGEVEKLKQQRLEQYAAKKAQKPALIAKSSILLDVKPWDDETDMAEMERLVRSVEADGLVWGAAKLVPLAYGIKKLQIMCVVEDDKVGTDFLEEKITAFEELVQSVDIAAFNKV